MSTQAKKPPQPIMKMVTLRMPAQDVAKLRRVAKANGVNMAEHVRQWVARLPEPRQEGDGKSVVEIIGRRK